MKVTIHDLTREGQRVTKYVDVGDSGGQSVTAFAMVGTRKDWEDDPEDLAEYDALAAKGAHLPHLVIGEVR